MASTPTPSGLASASIGTGSLKDTSGRLQYTYYPYPNAPESLQQRTRAALSSLLPHPAGTDTTALKMSGQAPVADHEQANDPIDATGTSGSGAHTLESQVGGHAGVLSSDDGSLIIKPTLHLEKEFYDDLAASAPLALESEEGGTVPALSPFEPLRPWVPKYYGTLRLEGRARTVEESGETVLEDVPEVKNKDESDIPC